MDPPCVVLLIMGGVVAVVGVAMLWVGQRQLYHPEGAASMKRRKITIVPILGAITEVRGTVAPTPQYRGERRWGVPLVAFEMTDTQQVTLNVAFVDKKGNPAKVDGTPEWLVDNPNVAALEPAADGKTCKVKAVGPLGDFTVTMKADALVGEGTEDLIGSYAGSITAGKATNVTITAGAVEEQPEAPPTPPTPPTPPAPPEPPAPTP